MATITTINSGDAVKDSRQVINTNFGNLNNDKEDVSNKRTSFQATPDDTAYPSEKLVKDSLDAKQATLVSGTNIKTINSETLLGSTDISLPTASSTTTFTNKRITPRITSEASSATPTINTDNVDAHSITALAADITSMTTNLSGTPTNFQKLIIRIKDNGTARAITWGSDFEAKGVALPTTTTISKVLTTGFIYDSVTSKWGCVASVVEA